MDKAQIISPHRYQPTTKFTRVSPVMYYSCFLADEIMTSRTQINRIDGVIIIVLASSAVDVGCDLELGQTKTYKIGICCF
jgi:hypothetical protein